MKITIYILLIFFSVFLRADISKYFKKAENKLNNHIIRNIDFIYLINLDKRPEKFQKSLNQLHPYEINPYRFSAVNGYAFSTDEINEMGVKLSPGMKTGDHGFCYSEDPDGFPLIKQEPMNAFGKTYFNVSHGGLGCVLSHLSILQDAYDSNYETIWVLEDDFEVLRDPRIISDLVVELDRAVGKNNWDILFTDVDRRDDNGQYQVVTIAPTPCRPNYSPPNKDIFSLRRNVNSHFKQVGARFGTHSMIVRRCGMKKILDFVKPRGIFLEIDQEIFLTEGIRLFTVTTDIVSNAVNSISDSKSSWDLLNKSSQ